MPFGVTEEARAQCVDACLTCAAECDAAAGRLVEGGQRATVDALIACVATSRLVADLLREGVEVDPGVLDLCVAACERCVELGIDGVDGTCRDAIDCLSRLL